eukprot:COSAG01_NODE_29359_length_639_cov_5.031481_2_plen_51_part_01
MHLVNLRATLHIFLKQRESRRRLSTGNPDYDKECTPALCKIAREAGQEVPP